jgi:hypothetical protein
LLLTLCESTRGESQIDFVFQKLLNSFLATALDGIERSHLSFIVERGQYLFDDWCYAGIDSDTVAIGFRLAPT